MSAAAGGVVYVSEAYVRLCDLAIARGCPTPLSLLDGAFEVEIDSQWKAAINGHATQKDWRGVAIPPYGAAIEFNGWPAGLMDVHGGIFAAGECANENAFIEAIRAALSNIEGGKA